MRPAVKVSIVVAVVAALVAVWAFTPLKTAASPDVLAKLFDSVKDSPWLPIYVLAAFFVAGALFISVWLVIFQTGLLFPPVVAFPLALLGSVLSALFFYGVGRAVGHKAVRRFAPEKVLHAVADAGLETIIAIRLVPVLPFTFVNLSCGAFNVPVRTFVTGTVIGMTPGILGMSLLGERLLVTLKNPTPGAVALLLGTAALLVGGATWFRRRAKRKLHVGLSGSSGDSNGEAAKPGGP